MRRTSPTYSITSYVCHILVRSYGTVFVRDLSFRGTAVLLISRVWEEYLPVQSSEETSEQSTKSSSALRKQCSEGEPWCESSQITYFKKWQTKSKIPLFSICWPQKYIFKSMSEDCTDNRCLYYPQTPRSIHVVFQGLQLHPNSLESKVLRVIRT